MIPDPVVDYNSYNPALVVVMSMFGIVPFIMAVCYTIYILTCADYF